MMAPIGRLEALPWGLKAAELGELAAEPRLVETFVHAATSKHLAASSATLDASSVMLVAS